MRKLSFSSIDVFSNAANIDIFSNVSDNKEVVKFELRIYK